MATKYKFPTLFELLKPVQRGSGGSGNFGHAGRPGQVGGSGPGGGETSSGNSSKNFTSTVRGKSVEVTGAGLHVDSKGVPYLNYNFVFDLGKGAPHEKSPYLDDSFILKTVKSSIVKSDPVESSDIDKLISAEVFTTNEDLGHTGLTVKAKLSLNKSGRDKYKAPAPKRRKKIVPYIHYD